MRNDLLQAKAAVDWPVSHFPSQRHRFTDWLRLNVDVTFRDPDPDGAYFHVVAAEKEPLPLAFNVEVGAYINTLRTSLDILATILAYRHNLTRPDKVYFPVVDSANNFNSGKFKGHEFVNALPISERKILESLKPYKGGNDLLWSLHHLDVTRKHRRLLTVEAHPQFISVTGVGVERNFQPVVGGGWERANNETILGRTRKSAPKPKVDYAAFIGFGEALPLQHANVVDMLKDFASLANSIINRFDTP